MEQGLCEAYVLEPANSRLIQDPIQLHSRKNTPRRDLIRAIKIVCWAIFAIPAIVVVFGEAMSVHYESEILALDVEPRSGFDDMFYDYHDPWPSCDGLTDKECKELTSLVHDLQSKLDLWSIRSFVASSIAAPLFLLNIFILLVSWIRAGLMFQRFTTVCWVLLTALTTASLFGWAKWYGYRVELDKVVRTLGSNEFSSLMWSRDLWGVFALSMTFGAAAILLWNILCYALDWVSRKSNAREKT